MDLTFDIKVGKEYDMEEVMKSLVNIQYSRAVNDFKP
jgi:excinuclease UvrABC helicase subunit UvrB